MKNSETDRDPGALENSHQLKAMRELYEKGELTRREFTQGLLAGGLGVAAASAFVGASFDVRAATPKRGGKVRFAHDVHGPDDTTDPAMFDSSIDYIRGRCHYNGLLQFNDDLTVRPELAEEYDANSDATEYTFKLRKDVAWHDGKKLTADDVIYSMNRHLGEDSTSIAKALVAVIGEWKKVDNHTVKAILNSPNVDIPKILATFHFKIIQDGAEGEYFQKPIGTGPFVCEEFTPGVRTISVRNENYWRDGPNLDEIETFAITDVQARVNALLAGDVELIGAVDPKSFDLISESSNAELFSVEGGAYHNIVAMMDRHPGNNRDFVLALKYLQRRDRVVKSFLKGQGAIGNDQPISPVYPEHCTELPQRPYDPDKAKFHWKKSGISSSNLPPLYFGDTDPGMVDTCLLLERETKKIGMDLKLKKVSTDGYWTVVWANHELYGSGWNMRPTTNIMLTLVYATNSSNNESAWNNERFEKLLVASRSEQDPAKQKEMYCEMQQLIADECSTIIPAHRNYVDGKAKKVKGLKRVPLGPIGGDEWPEYAWLDDQ